MKTDKELLRQMLGAVPDDLDKREGGLIFTALAPVAAMLAEQQCYLENVMDSTMPDTARGENLTRKCAELGVLRRPAAKAVRKGVFAGVEVPPGSRFGAQGIIYTAIAENRLECQQAGVAGNSYFGALLPVDIIPNLQSAALTDVLIAGEDEETDDALRARFYSAMTRQAFGGNIAQYLAELEKIAGVGAAKVFPTPENRGGAVQCVIVDPENRPVSETLLAQVQEHIDPAPQGKGYGLAPIGHNVTISTVDECTIAVAASISLKADYTAASLQAGIEQAVSGYFSELAFVENIVRISRVEAAILGVAGVADVRGATLNGQAGNLTLAAAWNNYEVPKLGAVTLTEVP